MKKRYFPCPICKAEGGWCDDYDDLGHCIIPIECGWCEGEGMVEINGEVHMKRKIEKAGMAQMNEDREYSWEEIYEMGRKALNL